MYSINAFVAMCLAPLAIAILISGLDDLVVDLVWFVDWVRRRAGLTMPRLAAWPVLREKRIAVFVPLWNEHAVIRRMLEHNIAAIDYRNYDFFVGAYPNDGRTQEAVREMEERYRHVHLAICPHDGPTSKADCLNWIYQRMLLHEESRRVRYDIVVIHDAEDLIHPDALRVLNNHADSFDMVQIPVLPLATPALELVHGVYCDEFAEFQMKDMAVRRMMGSFTPSSGVGTGYSRAAIEKLAAASSNRVFEPDCLTEDYENGMRLHELACPQIFVPLTADAAKAVATREYFPRQLRSAIRQRTRWVTGIALQTWERHGWKGSAGQRYWFWRDRKGLIGSPLSLAANLVFLWGLATYFVLPSSAALVHGLDARLMAATFALMVYRTAVRMACVGRLYGPFFALGVPVRSVCANFINAVSSSRALFRFARARIRHEPLVWVKTEHGYPSRNTLLPHKRSLHEILTGSGYITVDQLEEALRNKLPEMRLGGYLVLRGIITEEELCEALSLQQGLPAGPIEPCDVAQNAARALPMHLVRSWRVLPFRIAEGNLHLATPEVPTDEMARELRGFTGLEVRFQLVTAGNFEKLLNLL